jgi:hypothetical protein
MRSFINIYFLALFLFQSHSALSQKLNATIESDSILIGKELFYKIDVNLEKKQAIIFPDSASFVPFELLSETKVDTIQSNNGFIFSKSYAITSFDEGEYIIPKIKVKIGDKLFSTDSKKIKVNMVEVDTTKQGLYEIKPPFDDFSTLEIIKLGLVNNYLKLLSIILLILVIILFRKKIVKFFNPILNIKPTLSPLELADKRIIKLEKFETKSNSDIKHFYSELIFLLRCFLDKEIYSRALESTTNELISGLNNLRELKLFAIPKKSINRIQEILNRADLVKFAKFLPQRHISQNDLKAIKEEISILSSLIPEPSEEQKLKDLNYQKETIKRLRNARIKIVLFSIVVSSILLFIFSGFINGFQYTFDKITLNENLKLSEKVWVKSEYGSPGVFIESPDALIRSNEDLQFLFDDFNLDSQFYFSNSNNSIELFISNYSTKDKIEPDNFQSILEYKLDDLELKGLYNLLVTFEEFETNNKASGVVISGSSDYKIDKNKSRQGKYSVVGFLTETGFKTIVLLQHDLRYLDKIGERILRSIDVLKEKKK